MEICINNRPSLIALVGHACIDECDDVLDEWIKEWFATNTTYILNQRDNFLHMVNYFNDKVLMNC